MTLGIITINHNRPKVLKLWCAMIKRLREETETFIPAVVVSDEEDATICNHYKVVHITQTNNPVTAKFNRAFKYMQSIGIDAVMILGSDDIISTGFYLKSLAAINDNIDYVGTQSIYFYAGDGPYRGRLVRLSSRHTLGTGRTVSRHILDQCDWKLWNQDRNWGMDAIATKTIKAYCRSQSIIDDVIVDVKTRVNLNSFRVFGNRLPQCSPDAFYKILSAEELDLLNLL